MTLSSGAAAVPASALISHTAAGLSWMGSDREGETHSPKERGLWLVVSAGFSCGKWGRCLSPSSHLCYRGESIQRGRADA